MKPEGLILVNPLSPWFVGITGIGAKTAMPMRKPKPSPKEREVARKPRKPRARKSADRPLRRAAPPPPVFYRRGRPDI